MTRARPWQLLAVALPALGATLATMSTVDLAYEEIARAYGERQVTFAEYLAARKPIERRIEGARHLELTRRFGGHPTLWARGPWRSPDAEPQPARLTP